MILMYFAITWFNEYLHSCNRTLPDEVCTSCCIHLSRASQQPMWCVEFSGGGGVVISWIPIVVVCVRESSRIFIVWFGGRMRWIETTPECERMLPGLEESVLCVQYAATDFCRVFTNFIQLGKTKFIRTARTKSLCSLWFEHKYGWTICSNVINWFNKNLFTRH